MPLLLVDSGSVAAAAEAVRSVGAALDDAPGGAALRLVAASLPGSAAGRAAAGEAFEWGIEMAELARTFERYAAALEAALQDYRRHDADSASAVRSARVGAGR